MADQRNEQWGTLAATSSSALTGPSQSERENCDPRQATRLAAKLFGCYRASEANDPDVYVTAAARLLANFREAIARQVADPVSGLPSTNQWLPSIAEIRVTCDKLMAPIYAERRRDALRGETARIRQGYRPLADEHARVHAAMAALQQELESKATPRPQPFTLKLEEGVDAYPGRGPPTLSSQVMGKYTRPADPLHERDDDESFEDREFLP